MIDDLAKPERAVTLFRKAIFRSAMRQILFGLETLIVLSFLSSPTGATTIVGVRTPTKVVIGADSKRTARLPPYTMQHCKIGVVNNVAWGLAGISQPDSYMPNDDIEFYLRSSGSLGERITQLEFNLEKKLSSILPPWRTRDPEVFEKTIDGKIVVAILFAAEDAGSLRMFSRSLGSPKGSGGSVKVQREEFRNERRPAVLGTPLGVSAIKKEISSRPGLFDELGQEQGVKRLIEIAIDAHPAQTGAPVSIIRVDTQGLKWIDRGACAG